jgi:hypothetical protein
LHKNSFARTEWAVKKDEIASDALCTDALAEAMHFRSCSNLHWLRIVERKEEGPQLPGALLLLTL